MDITKGSLDEIARPSSNSRINHRSKALSASLEFLTPDPDIPKECSHDLYNIPTEDGLKENDDENEKEYETKTMNTSGEISEEKTICTFQQLIQNTIQVTEKHSKIFEHNEKEVKEQDSVSNYNSDVDSMNGFSFPTYISGSADSEDDGAESKLSSCSNVPQDKQAKLHRVKLEDSKESKVDCLIQQAIEKMKRLDQILANKQSQEKAVKKQGKEMRTKLWEELQSMTSQSFSVATEEAENTSRFLALASETSEPAAVDEDEMFIGVFHTQINSENYEYRGRPVKQGCLNAERTRSSMRKTENMHQKTETSPKNPNNFIKKNIELVKEFGNQVVMLEEEKKRLSELLKDTGDDRCELQVLEGEANGWLVPGEGYTPEPMEYHYLTELEAKLKVVISDGDFSTIQSSFSKVPKQIYQESLAYANRELETVPGEKVLRDTKEERNQQNRLKEIDQQLKNLERTADVLPSVSKERLNVLLEEYMQPQRTITRLFLTAPEGSFFDGMSPRFDQSENSTPEPKNDLLDDTHGVGMFRKQEVAETMGEDVYSKETLETTDCNDSKALVVSQLSEEPVAEKKENDDQEVQQEMLCTSNSAGYFMSIALSTDKPKKPSFLDEPFYCTSTNNELSTDVDIPGILLKTRGGEVLNKPVE
ncbi:PREDICTED: fibrous sheath-interacting protein 1 [Gekko japonicus]|uniref:Fibrous sheath-interacting protein 1 n=1 Tax=Gekko japonicus TaxID=146911 RepID=A0ABM1KVD1_GEKJA|nr:PREDICTED: fibrous sheath-interacting protein 1 [Gekko japonicus]